MRIVFMVSAMLLLTVSQVQPASARNQREKAALQFEQFWNGRLSGYTAQAVTVGAKHKAAMDALLATPFAFADGDDRLMKFSQASDADAYVSGRGQELEAFLAQFKSRPSFGLLQAYLQGRISEVTALPASVEAKRQEMLAIIKRPGATMGQLFVAIETASMARGDAVGRADELKLILENAGAYATDYADASQRDAANRARWAAALGAIGQSLNRPTYTVNCTGFANTVNCTGR